MSTPLFIRQNRKLVKVQPETIRFILIEKNYTKIVFYDDSGYMVRSTLGNILARLPKDMFIQTHRSYAVNINHIKSISSDHMEIDDHAVPIGRQYQKEFLSMLNVLE